MRSVDTDVLVVGAGLAAAASLAREAVRMLSIARHPGTAHSPRAHTTEQRTPFRVLGVENRDLYFLCRTEERRAM